MTRSWRVAAIAILVAGSVLAPATAGAQDDDHSGPDEHSQNMKLLSNVEASAPGVTQSDIAFGGNYAYAGNYQGFRIIDISSPAKPRVVSNFFCNGLQGDISVFEGLAFQSVDAPQSGPGCSSTNVNANTEGMWEGIRVFDVSNPANPVHLDSYQTDCGSHTHTLLPRPDLGKVLIYVSSYPLTQVNIGQTEDATCLDEQSEGGHGYISIIEVPLDDPTNETVHRHFLDESTEVVTYDLDLALGTPPGTLGTHTFSGCHDISVFVELDLAAAACFRDAQLWDISDPVNPEFLWTFKDDAIVPDKLDLWHSAAFSWDGEAVAFGDESGGGVFNRCTDPTDNQGRVWFLDIDDGKLLANYKVPRAIEGDDACTMHNFNFIPKRDGSKVLVSAAYTAGTTVVDVDALIAGASEADAEVGYYRASGANTWSSYWYNGFIYANDHHRGVDTFQLSDKARAGAVKLPYMNAQTQESAVG